MLFVKPFIATKNFIDKPFIVMINYPDNLSL